MSYRTVRHDDSSPNDEKLRLISPSKRPSWKVVIGPGRTMSRSQWPSGIWRVILIGGLAFSGCTSEHWGGQEKGSAATKPVYQEAAEASWYGSGFQGEETASGETFDQKEMTAAHPSLPMGTKANVTDLENGRKVEVRINDCGPYAEHRIDLSRTAAKKLDMEEDGATRVMIETKPVKQ